MFRKLIVCGAKHQQLQAIGSGKIGGRFQYFAAQ